MKNYLHVEKEKKGFTLIELLAVIAIVGVLVLLATPSFLGNAEKAKLAQIKNDTKVYEGILAKERLEAEEDLDEDEYFSKYGYELMDKEELSQAIKVGKVYTTGGKFTGNYDFFNEVYRLPSDFGDSKLEGDFIYSEDLKKVLYVDKKGSSIGEEKEEEVVLATDEDFKFIEYNSFVSLYTSLQEIDGKKGYWAYIGKDKRVQIPDEIQGHKVTNAFMMFRNTEVEEVVLNKNIDSINSIFYESKANKNIIDEGENNIVKDAGQAFEGSSAKEINIDKFKGDSLLSIAEMFAKTLDEREIKLNFNSKEIQSISTIFLDSSFKKIDISSLDLDKVNTTAAISTFKNSKAEEIILGPNFKKLKLWDITSLFDGAKAKAIDLENIDMRYARDVSNMFRDSAIEKIDLSHTSANEVTRTKGFAFSAKASEIILPEMNFLKVEDASQMFFEVNLKTLNLSNLDVSNVKTFDSFLQGSEVENLKLFDFKNVDRNANLHQMFGDFNTKSVIDISNLENDRTLHAFLLRANIGGLIADNVHLKESKVSDFNKMNIYGDLSLKNVDEKTGEIILRYSDVRRNSSKKPVITVTSSDLYKLAFDKYSNINNVDVKLN